MKKLIWILCLAFLAPEVSAQNNAFSLQQAIDYAMKNDRTLRNSNLNVKQAEGQMNEIRAIGMPKLSGGANYQYFIELPTSLIPANFFNPQAPADEFAEVQFGTSNNLTASLDFSMLLFDGTYLTALKASKMYKEFIGLQVKQAEKELKDKVIDAYVATLIFGVTEKTFENNISSLEKLLKETQATVKAGFAEQLDADRLELSVQNLKNDLDNLRRQEQQVQNILKFQMSFPLDEEITLTDNIDLLLANEFAVKNDDQLDLSNRPELAVVDKSLELSDMDIEQYRMGYYPSVAGFASYQYQIQGNNLFTNSNGFPVAVAGLQLNVPIFDGFEKRSKIQQAKVSKEITTNQRADLVRAINLEVETARISYKNAFERVNATKKSLELAEKIQNTTSIKFKEGVGSSFEVIQASQDVYGAQGSYQQALYDYLKAKADFKKALGK